MAAGDQFAVTQEALREAFDRLNAELFEGRLASIPLELSGEAKRGGAYRAKAERAQPNPRLRRLTRNFGIRNLRDESISISRLLCLTQDTLDRFMAHEMVHQWQGEVLGISEDEGGHGDSFRRKTEEINAVKGPGFVTATSDVVAGGIGGREGQVYHVVVFERGGHKFGGFSRRPLGAKEREVIEQVVKCTGASYRVLSTTSHDAQVLLDLSRLKPGARRRSWPRIPADIYESIVGGEVAAPLRDARLRLADLGGITLYHGTGLREAAAIARSGIRSFSGDRWSSNPGIANAGTDAIYLTPDFALALRYAQGLAGDRTPAVLECRVSGRHMKKLRTDPMDTWEGSWDEDGGSDSLPQRVEALWGLHGDARDFLADAGVRGAYRMEWPDDSDDCDGLNLYKLALRLIRASADPDAAREAFRRFREKFPPGDHGYFHIREDGTIRLDSSYWEEAHQVQYAPRQRDTRSPTRLPPAAIKAAWIPAQLAAAAAETRSARPRKLPCESKAEFDEETKVAESVPDWCDRLEEAESAEDVRAIRVNGIDVDDITDDFPEPLLAVRELAMSIAESPGEDHAQRIEGLRDEWGEYEPYERWGEDTYGEPVEMAKVPLEALRPAPEELVTAALRRAAATATLAGEGETVRYRGELWHGTTLGRAASIARGGFAVQPHGEMSCDAVSLSRNSRAAEIFAGGDGAVFQLDAALDRLLVLPDFVYDAMACYRGSGACNEDRLVEDADRLRRLGVVRPEWPGDEPPGDSDWTGGMNDYDWLEKALPGYDGVIVPGFDSAHPNAEAEIAVFADAASRLKGMVVAIRIGREWYDAADGWKTLLKTEPERFDDDYGIEAALRAAASAVALAGKGETVRYRGELWHGTTLGRAASIARGGFAAQPHGEMNCDAVSLSGNLHAAEFFASEGEGAVFKFDADLRLFVLPEFVYNAMCCYRGSGWCDEKGLLKDADKLRRLGVVHPGWPGDEPPEKFDWAMNEHWLEKALPGYDGVIVDPDFDSAQPDAEAEIAVFAVAAARLKDMVTAIRIGREWYDADDAWKRLLKKPRRIAALRAAALDIGASSGAITAYHATLSGSDILRGGFRKSDDVGRLGLGGGSLGGSVSFTTDWGVAKGIHRAFVMMHSLVNAADPLAAMREHLESLDPGVAEAVLEYWKSADGGDLRELLSGWKPRPYGSRMQTYDQLVRQGFKPVHAAGDEGGEGGTLYYHWLEPVTGKDAERMVYTYVKVYFYANPAEYNPVFMGGDSSHFKGIPRDDIGIFTVELSIDPSKKRKSHGDLHSEPGYAILPAESEYRVSDLSMISAILDYDPRPGDAPPIRGEERSYHEAPEVEAAVNALLGLLSRHRALLTRAGIDVRQAAAELRNADDMDGVARVAVAVLKASGLRGAAGTLRNIARLRSQIEPSGTAKAALDALPETVREEAAGAPPTARFSDISERWYGRDEAAYIAWATALGGMGVSESEAERAIDDWIWGRQHGRAERLAEELRWAERDIPGFSAGDAEAYLELAERLADPAGRSAALKVALRTVFEAGDPAGFRRFILRRGKLWLWSDDIGGDDERRLVESVRDEFGTDKPPFDQRFPVDSKWRVRDLFEPSELFGPPSDEDLTKFRQFASDTIYGSVSGGTVRAKTVGGLPMHADHPELRKLLRHLGAEAEGAPPPGMWFHGFTATPGRMAGVARFGLRPGESSGESSNWPRIEFDRSLVYLTTDESTAKGHACGEDWSRHPYAVVVAVRESDLDPARMEADFDAERGGFRPNRAGLAGYRGRIPSALFAWVKVFRNGYNTSTTPLLLTLGPDEFAAVAGEYEEWLGRTKDDRRALRRERGLGPGLSDRKKVKELEDRIGTDPVAASLRSAGARVAGEASRRYRLPKTLYHGTTWPSGEEAFTGLSGAGGEWGAVWLADTESNAEWFAGWRDPDPEDTRVVFRVRADVRPERVLSVDNETWAGQGWLDLTGRGRGEPDETDDRDFIDLSELSDFREIYDLARWRFDAVAIPDNYAKEGGGADIAVLDDSLLLTTAAKLSFDGGLTWTGWMPTGDAAEAHERRAVSAALTDAGRRVAAAAYGTKLAGNRYGGVTVSLVGADGEPLDGAIADVHMGTAADFQGDGIGEYDYFNPNEPIEEGGAVAVLTNLEVPEGMRGVGLGRLLTEEAARWAFAHGAEAMYAHAADVGGGDPEGFYERLGFETVDRDSSGQPYMRLLPPGPGARSARKSEMRERLEAAVEAAGMSGELAVSSSSSGKWLYLQRTPGAAMSKLFTSRVRPSGGRLWLTMLEVPEKGVGAGRRFVEKVEEIARAAGITRIEGKALHESAGFWRAVGYEETGVSKTDHPADRQPYHMVRKVLASRPKGEPAFLTRLREAGAAPPAETASGAVSAVMSGTLVHNAAGSVGGDAAEKVRSILDSGIDSERWVQPHPGRAWSGHPKAAYLTLSEVEEWAEENNPPPNYVFAKPALSKPLVLWGWRDGAYAWGDALAEATGKSGAALTSLLRRHGYDSIITVREGATPPVGAGEVGEIAYFGRRPLPAYLPHAGRAAGLLAAAAEIVRRAAVEDVYRGVKEVVAKYKGRGLFARFSDVPKVGIRPSTEHHDPYGVYFYPIDWLAKEGGWGTTYISLPYITVARIRRSGWLNLATLRPDRARQLAEKGGVLEEYEARTKGKGLNKARGGRAGKRLWDAVEAKVKPFESDANKMEWNRIFGRMGVKAVYDPGTGSVNANEPSQIVVLDLSLIDVVDVVENREDRKSVFHAVLKVVADGVLDGGWRVSGSYAEGGITASGAVGGKPVALSVMPAKGGFEVEVALSYHDPAGRKRRVTSRGRMPNEWEDAPADYLAGLHAQTIRKALEDAELGQAGAPDATDELDRALRAMTRLRLPDIHVEDAGDGSARFWKNMGDGKVEGSLRIDGARRSFELYAEVWLFFSREMPEDAAAAAYSHPDYRDTWVIEVGPMRVSWEGDDPSSAAGGMAAEAERALRDVRVTDEKDDPRPGADLEQAGEIARQRVLVPTLAEGMVGRIEKAASGVSYWHGSSGENIRKMAAEGYVNPGVPEGGPSRRYQAPMSGRTYATKDLGYALIYAIEAAMVGQELPADNPRFDGVGGIALLEPEGDARPLPDEDWVGKLLTDGEERSRRVQTGAGRNFEMPEWKVRLYDSLRRRLPPQVVSRLGRKPAWKLGEMATQSMLGKAVNRWLLRNPGPLADELTQRSPHHSFPGRMRVVRAWVFDKRGINPKLKPDGSNFMELATEIPVARPKAASGPLTSPNAKVPFKKLPSAVQADIAANLDDTFFADTDVSYEVLLEVLAEMDTHLAVARLPVAGLADQVRATRGAYSASDPAVSGLAGKLRSGGDLDPILVDGDSFFDGGHRVMAYEYEGRDTIPTVDISPLLAADWEVEFCEEIPGLARRAAASKEFWQMTRREFMHPKFDVRALDRIANGKEGDTVGTLGDYFRGEKLRALYALVLDTPIMVVNGPVEGGKRVRTPEGYEFKGAYGAFRGRPTIFLPSGTINGLIRAMLEEGAHAMRESKGRESPKTSMKDFDWDAYEALPHERSAAAMSEYALSLREKDHRELVEEALAAGKPVPPEVLADYPDMAPAAASRAAAALARAAAAVGPEPWQMTQAGFLEALNRDSGKKCLPDYKPKGAEHFAHMDSEPKSDIGSVALRDGGTLELMRSGKLVPWGRYTRRPDGSERYESAGERPEETVFALVDGRVVGYAGDSFGATEMFVAKEEQGRGIGSALYKAYLEEFPHRQCAGGFTAAGEMAAKATHRRFVEEAVREGKPVPPEVLADYPHGFGSLLAAVEFRGDPAALKEMREYLELYGLLKGSGDGWVRSEVRPARGRTDSTGNVLAMQQLAEKKSGGTLEGALLLPPGYPPAAADGMAADTGWGRSGSPLQKAAAREWYYHGSAPDDILDIAQWGLLARGDREGVSVTTTPGRAKLWAGLKAPRDAFGDEGHRIVVFRMPASAIGPLEPEDAAPAEPDKDFTARAPIQPESLQIRHGGGWVPLLDVYGEFLDAPADIETPPGTSDGSKSASAPSAPDLRAMRAFLERKWAERGRPEPGQNCVATASFLSKAIPGAAVRGGQPEGHRDLVRHGLATEEEARSGGGYRDADGCLLPHLWAEADGVIYDLTADQFGGDPATAVGSGDPRYVPSKLSAKNMSALRAADEETDGWMEEWTAARRASATPRDPKTTAYYHGTTAEALRSIEADGRLLAPVYMADTSAAARGFAEMTCDAAGLPGRMAVVLKVMLPAKAVKKLKPDPDFAHGSGNFVLDDDVPLEWVPWYPDPDEIAPLASAISRAARALGEHLGETVTAFRAVGAEQAEGVIRGGFSGRGATYYTTDWGRACFYARFMPKGRWGAIFEVEADSSRSQIDVNDMTPEQTDEAFGGVSEAAYDMAAAIRSRTDRRLPDAFDRELEHWLGGQLMSEGYYDAPRHPSAWQLVSEVGKMTLAEARGALPPGRYGDFVTIDSRGAPGVDADRLPGATQALTGNVPADRIAAVWLPSALLEAAGDAPPAGAAREIDQVDVIPAQFEPEDPLVEEIEKQVRRRVRRHKELAQELEQIDEAAAMSEDEVARYLGGLDERNPVVSGHVYSKLRRGEEVTAEDLEREEAYFRYELPRDRTRAVKAIRKALTSSPAAGKAIAATAETEGCRMTNDPNRTARALRRAAETVSDPAGWSEESDVDPADFVDEGFVPDESGHEFWGSRGSGLLFVRDHPEEGGQLLAVHRSSSVEEPDTWGTTGGAVPKGETNDFASAVRETREEIGSIPKYRPVRQYVWKAPAPGTFQYTTFILECLDMDWLPDAFNWEAQDARWVSLDEAASLDLHFGLSDLLNKLGASIFPRRATPRRRRR